MTIESVNKAISKIFEENQGRGIEAHRELQECIIRSKQSGKWEDCKEPPGISFNKIEHSHTNEDGSSRKWEWGEHGEYVYCKTSTFGISVGWSSTIARKPLIFSDVLEVLIGGKTTAQ
jgi:hypothetical protein